MMTASGAICLAGALLGLISQLNWMWGNGPDAIWWLRLLLGGGGGWLLARAGTALYRRLARRPLWPSFPDFCRGLARPGRLAGLTFFFFLCLYLLSMGGHFYSYDARFRFQTTKALVERGSLVIRVPPQAPPIYSKYGIVQPLLTIPLYLLGRALPTPGGENPRPPEEVAASTLMQVVSAASLALVLLILLELGYSRGLALAVALVTGLATMAWPYAKYFFSEPLNGFFLLLCLHQILVFKRTRAPARLLGAGTALALGAANAPMLLATAAPLFGAYLAWLIWPRARQGRRDWGRTLGLGLCFGLPLLIALAFILGFNAYRFGSPFTTGYEGDRGFVTVVQDGKPGFSLPWWVGLYGLLFSAGKSLFLYNPPVILALLGLGPFLARRRPEALLVLGLFLAWLAFYCRWWAWHGDICWGPRYLVPVLPLVMLPLAETLASAGQRGRAGKLALLGILGLGLVLQLLAISVPFYTYFQAVEGPRQSNWHLLHYVPQFSPLVGQVKVVARLGASDFFLKKTAAALPLAWAAGLSGLALWLGVGRGLRAGDGPPSSSPGRG